MSFDCRFFYYNKYKKLSRGKVDSRLNFVDHVKTISSKTSSKLRTLARATPGISMERRKTSSKFFFECTIQLLSINRDFAQSQ